MKVEDWAEIRRLNRSEGMGVKAIARRMGVSRNTVRAALRAVDPPRYTRSSPGSIVDAVEGEVRALLREMPEMPATVIAERIGWKRGLTVLKQRVHELRPEYRPPDPTSRTTYLPGQLAQCDLWFPAKRIPLGSGVLGAPPVLVMVLGYSRWLMARMLPSRLACDLVAGHWALLSELGAVPRALVWDNEAAVGSWRKGHPVLTQEFGAFRGSLGVQVIQCAPRDPEAKGVVERSNGYLETSFLPGRQFQSAADFNQQLSTWLVLANQRRHRTIECRPLDRLAEDRSAMVGLPPTPALGRRWSTRLNRDHYVRVHTCDYSVHPSAIGRRVDVLCDLESVRVHCGGRLVAEHERCWAPHQTLTDPAHAAAGAEMRRARRVAASVVDDSEVQVRPLSVYDDALVEVQ